MNGNSGNVSQYNDQVSFVLPSGYVLKTAEDSGGNNQDRICFGKGTDDDGNETWKFSAAILPGASDTLEGYTRKQGESILDFYKRGLENSRFAAGATASDTSVYTIKRPVRIFGRLLKFKVVGILAVIDPDHVLLIQAAVQQDDDNPDEEVGTFRRLLEIGSSIRINGKPVDFSRFDAKKLTDELKLDYDEENDESSVNLGIDLKVKNADGDETDAGRISISGKPEEGKKKVTAAKAGKKKKRKFAPLEQEGSRLIFGGCWSMDLVSDCRLAREPLDDESDGKQYVIQCGTRDVWTFIVANEKDSQTLRSAVSEISQGVLEKIHDSHNIIDKELRRDENLTVSLHASIAASGFSCAMVKVENPDGEIWSLTSTLPDIDDMKEAMEKLNNEEIGIVHPFGGAWEAQWTLMMRMIASIRSLDDPEPDDESWAIGGYEYALNPETEIIPGVRCRIPKTALKISENTYTLTEFGLDQKQQVSGSPVLTFSFIHSEREEAFDKQSSEPHNRLMITHLGKGFASVLREKRTEGFHACLGYVPLGNGRLIISLIKDQLIGQILIEPADQDNHPVQYEAMKCAEKLLDSLACGSMREEAPAVFPPTPDFLHEHYDLVESGSYTTHRDADFTGQSIRMLLKKHGNEDEEAYQLMKISGDTYRLDRDAVSLAKVFRLDSSLFDPYGDTEALIRKGMFKEARCFEALRSLAWTVSCMADRAGREPGEYTYEELEDIGSLIQEQNYLNYTAFSYMPGLCDHYDWRVFYVPDEYMRSDYQKSNDLRYLTGKENRGGNSTTILLPGMLGLGSMNRVSSLIGRNEETLESLEALRKDLEALLPVMETIHDGLLDGRDRSEKPEGTLADALTAWCALAVAAKEPFYSEEAANTAEADAGLDEPLKRPTDALDDKPAKSRQSVQKASGTGRPAAKAKAAPAAKKAPAKPAGEVLELNGETVIQPGRFAGNMELKNIIIPEGVTEIGERAFYSCMFLESVIFPKSLKKIDQFAFMSCRALKKVELQEGIEELETHAFGATNNLKEVRLPDSLKKVDRTVFGMGGDSPYATAYMSGELADRLMAEYNKNNSWPSDAIYARHYVIDGVGYENMTDYLKSNKASSGKASAKTASSKSTPGGGSKSSAGSKSSKLSKEELLAKVKRAPQFFNTPAESYDAERRQWVLDTFEIIKELYRDNPAPSYAAMKREYPTIDWEPFEYLAQREITNKKSIPQFLKEQGLVQDKNSASAAARAGAAPKAAAAKKAPTPKKVDIGVRVLEVYGKTKIEESKYMADSDTRPLEIPEGITEIERSAFMMAKTSSVKLPRSLKIIGPWAFDDCVNLESVEMQEGLEEIGSRAFARCEKLTTVRLPSTIRYVDRLAFVEDIGSDFSSKITLHIPGVAARRIEKNKQFKGLSAVIAAGFMIDGTWYPSLESYVEKAEAEEKARIERERAVRRAKAERERQERERREAEARKEQRKTALLRQIHDLETERDAVKGLFAGMKRNKIQKQIDGLKGQLREL